MIGILCGFKDEVLSFQRVAKQLGLNERQFLIEASGSSSTRAQHHAQNLVKKGAKTLISYGISGGLHPQLIAGDVIFSNHIVTTLDESYGTRAQKKEEKLMRLNAGPRIIQGTLCGVDEIVFTPDEKSRLFKISRAHAADMESHAIARIASQNSLPFFGLRAISDTAKDTLPFYLANSVDETGTPQIGVVLKGLLSNPLSLPHLLKIGKNTKFALERLEEAGLRTLPNLIKAS